MSGEQINSAVVVSSHDLIEVSLHDETEGILSLLQAEADPPSTQTPQNWADVGASTLAGEGVTNGHLEVFLVSKQRMAELNQEHMGSSGPTDVLAFPLDGQGPDELGGKVDVSDFAVETNDSGTQGPVERHLGDIVICPAVAGAQAASHAGSFDAELTLLMVHGVLHVLGYDHYEPEEAEIMRATEQHYLASHGFSHPGPPAESGVA